jgi:chitin disaccharide deacetylase
MKQIIVNADDYGYSPGIDAAILDLAEKNVVTATTALVCSPRWPEAAKLLRDAPLSAGLHLDFTNGFAPTNKGADLPVKQLILKAWSRSLSRAAVAQSVNEQLDKFEQAMGRAPAIVDGHEHCHQFPVIREALIDALVHRYAQAANKPLLRNTAPHAWRGSKAALIGALGSRSLRRLARQAGFAMSGDFAGVYDFASSSDLRGLWQQWLQSLQAQKEDTGKMMIMCHPGYQGNTSDIHDSIYASRVKEAAFLGSDVFTQLCAAHQVQLVRA